MAVLPERLNAACLTMTATGLKKRQSLSAWAQV